MPRRDGTGPMGAGLMTGRGLGFCTGFGVKQNSSKTQKELLNEQKTMLQDQLEAVDKQLEDL